MKIGYARVSTRSQNPEAQVMALKEYGCDRVYDEVISGGSSRTMILELLDEMEEGDELVVCKLDRLCRNLRNFLEIMEKIQKRKIGLKVLHEHVDTESSMGKMMMNMTPITPPMSKMNEVSQ